jgi:hypothetical protein
MGFPNPWQFELEGPGGGAISIAPVQVEIEGPGAGPIAIAPVHLSVDALPTIHLSIDNIPQIQLGVDLKITELPSIRGHLPADFCVGLSVLGFELLSLRLCGEAQIITEPYHPNPCEVCREVARQP